MAQAPTQTETPVVHDTLVVGTKITAPFVMERPDGSLHGLTIDLWESIAREEQLLYRLERYPDVPSLVKAVEEGKVDVAAAALSITEDRERRLDFTQPFFVAGLQIATRIEQTGPLGTLKQFFSWQFVQAIGALALVIFVFGFLMWLVERKRNPDHFENSWKGLGSGFWWSAVTMTTVGYGDKAPVSMLGRGVAVVWMFLALIIFSGFTAAITSALTVDRLAEKIDGPEDLRVVRVGTVSGSNTETYLQERRISSILYSTPDEAMEALANEEIDALVYDGPILRYLIHDRYKGELKILPYQLQQFYYGLALPNHSPLRDDFNVRLLQQTASPQWRDWKFRYMGSDID